MVVSYKRASVPVWWLSHIHECDAGSPFICVHKWRLCCEQIQPHHPARCDFRVHSGVGQPIHNKYCVNPDNSSLPLVCCDSLRNSVCGVVVAKTFDGICNVCFPDTIFGRNATQTTVNNNTFERVLDRLQCSGALTFVALAHSDKCVALKTIGTIHNFLNCGYLWETIIGKSARNMLNVFHRNDQNQSHMCPWPYQIQTYKWACVYAWNEHKYSK